MSDEWEKTTLGEIAEIVGGGTPKTGVSEYWGGDVVWLTPSEITKHEGETLASSERMITLAGLAASAARIVPAGTVLVTSRATIGATAIAGCELATNQGFASLVPSGRALSRFLLRWVQANKQELISRAGGNTFLEVSKKSVSAIPISLPPLDQQRRIVSVMDAIDDQVKATEREVLVTERLLAGLLEDAFEGIAPRRAFGEVARASSGPSWSAKDETEEPVDGAIRVLKITNTRPDGSIDLTGETYVSGLPASTRRVASDSLIMIRTNGNRRRIGNVYRPTPEALDCAVSAFQFLVRVNDEVDRDYLYWALRRPSAQAAMSDAASGTTGLGNLAVKWLNTLAIPWPDDAHERDRLVGQFDAVEHHLASLTAELERLRAVRSATLNALLSREVEIPESFDETIGLEGVA